MEMGLFLNGSRHQIPTDMKELLKLSEFKRQLLRFVFKEFEDQIYSPIIGTKVFYCYFVVDGTLKVEIEDAMYGCHSEADTRVMLHAKHADQYQGGNIVIRVNDTNIAVICATNAKHLERSRIWIDAGYNKDNSRAYIDMTTLSKDIKNIEALAAIYAFTGCDYSPSFHRKGKVTRMKLMDRYPKFVEVFSKFGEV